MSLFLTELISKFGQVISTHNSVKDILIDQLLFNQRFFRVVLEHSPFRFGYA